MTKNELLQQIMEQPALKVLPLLGETIRQKWEFSHYLHGAVALEAGLIGQRPEAECVAVAAGLEVGWAAILILDDMVDNDQVRYHGPSAWAQGGYPKASMEMACGLLVAGRLVESSDREAFLRACSDTIDAMKGICSLPLDTGLLLAEAFFRNLGALSCFAVAWPWPGDVALWQVAGYETCAGQLVNDCNDCFGAKALRRGYPDIRNHQVSLLTAILHDHYKHLAMVELVASADGTSSERVAARMLSVLQENPKPLLRVFNKWRSNATELAEGALCAEAGAWAKRRIEKNFAEWRKKLLRLLQLTEE
ncbi:MAG: hypothetical protein ACOYOS_16830 [Syntrophales bacterium]